MATRYYLKDRAFQEKLDDLTDGDFSKGLAEAVRSTPTGSPHVCVGCGATINPHAPEHLHIPRACFYFMKDEIEAVPVYDPKAWNEYPAVEPPPGVWMRLETEFGGKKYGHKAQFVCGSWRDSWDEKVNSQSPKVRFRPWDEEYEK